MVPGCTDPTACNYNAAATVDNGTCNPVDCLGNCMGAATGPAVVGSSCNDGNPTTVNDVYGSNCLCFGTVILGCTDPTACNYFAAATVDDGNCNPSDCLGNCTGTATGPAIVGSACNDGNATTVNDTYNGSCVCVGTTIPGCTDATACNYNASATVDDGTCNPVDCLGNCSGSATGPAIAGSACNLSLIHI